MSTFTAPALFDIGEQWLPVVGYEGRYEVSSEGRVRSWVTSRPGGEGRSPEPKALVIRRDVDGYALVGLRLNGSPKPWKVHHLVAFAFIGPRPDGLDICHNNGDRLDARLSNLRYGTKSENAQDRVLHGNCPNASKQACVNGHPLDSANTYFRPSGGRDCRACGRERVRRYQSRRAA